MTIRFKFAAHKAYAAIHWMVSEQRNIDLHALLKACYFADKSHLNAFYRPIFGATYKAMRFGPVPLEIYEMVKGEVLWKAEIGVSQFPWELDGYRLHIKGNERPNIDKLSDTNFEHLTMGFKKSVSMTFTERTDVTHGLDWQRADLGTMRYEDMLEDAPDKNEIIENLEANSKYMRL
jgi:hypothetical protein